jgi:phosphoglycerol transferase
MTASEFSNIEVVKGLSGAEPWGKWTDGSTVAFKFKDNLPKDFRLLLMVNNSFGPNIDKQFNVNIATQSQRFAGPARPKLVQLEFKDVPGNTRDITIRVPAPQSPLALGIGKDARKLGLGLIFIALEPITKLHN